MLCGAVLRGAVRCCAVPSGAVLDVRIQIQKQRQSPGPGGGLRCPRPRDARPPSIQDPSSKGTWPRGIVLEGACELRGHEEAKKPAVLKVENRSD